LRKPRGPPRVYFGEFLLKHRDAVADDRGVPLRELCASHGATLAADAAMIGVAATTDPDVRENVRSRLLRAAELTHANLRLDVAYVLELTEDGPLYRAAAGDTGAFHVALDCDSPAHASLCRELLAGRLPNVVADAAADPRLEKLRSAHHAPVGAFVGVPLRYSDGGPFGVLFGLTHGARHDLEERDTRLLSMLGEAIVDDLDEHRSRARMRAEIQRLIDKRDLRTAYQPIIDVRSELCVGIEALARFPAPFSKPEWAFAASHDVGLGLELERLVIHQAWKLLPRLGPDQYLAINVAPHALVELARRANARAELPLEQLVVEVTEHAVVDCYRPLLKELAPLRERGLRIAVDDAGAGYASLRHVLELRPDFIKIDRSLIHGIARDHAQQVAVAAFLSLAADLNARVVAEGVERAEDLEVAIGLGVYAAQGFLLGKPTTSERVIAGWIGAGGGCDAKRGRNRAGSRRLRATSAA
jgi:EAL domain-containing protein (putative c-di-GMP-specific phosphodiesterase class I)